MLTPCHLSYIFGWVVVELRRMQVGSRTYPIAAAKLETDQSHPQTASFVPLDLVLYCDLFFSVLKLHLVVLYLFATYSGFLDDVDDRVLLLSMQWRLRLGSS